MNAMRKRPTSKGNTKNDGIKAGSHRTTAFIKQRWTFDLLRFVIQPFNSFSLKHFLHARSRADSRSRATFLGFTHVGMHVIDVHVHPMKYFKKEKDFGWLCWRLPVFDFALSPSPRFGTAAQQYARRNADLTSPATETLEHHGASITNASTETEEKYNAQRLSRRPAGARSSVNPQAWGSLGEVCRRARRPLQGVPGVNKRAGSMPPSPRDCLGAEGTHMRCLSRFASEFSMSSCPHGGAYPLSLPTQGEYSFHRNHRITSDERNPHAHRHTHTDTNEHCANPCDAARYTRKDQMRLKYPPSDKNTHRNASPRRTIDTQNTSLPQKNRLRSDKPQKRTEHMPLKKSPHICDECEQPIHATNDGQRPKPIHELWRQGVHPNPGPIIHERQAPNGPPISVTTRRIDEAMKTIFQQDPYDIGSLIGDGSQAIRSKCLLLSWTLATVPDATQTQTIQNEAMRLLRIIQQHPSLRGGIE